MKVMTYVACYDGEDQWGIVPGLQPQDYRAAVALQNEPSFRNEGEKAWLDITTNNFAKHPFFIKARKNLE